ncbi:hypothetical protein GTW46_14510, partial [Streptomyces sp. SID6013]|nr:hypothetical protein [Streptomyces sp. SID6013]
AWLEERVERDIGRPTDTELRAAVDAIAKRLLVEDLSNGLPQRIRQGEAADRPQPSPRSPDARTGVG